ncbi:MAG: MFS transporter [Actinomycetota bacterium]|nr:MFS transporter [Actinomycetota bacterium]MDQ3899874.1 MFS transporter [Actinomycetota bacterium]
MAEGVPIVESAARPFELWMTSNLSLGLAFNCLLPVLLPSYVLSTGGSATDVWVAMAMAGLFALLGPWIGRLAGRRRAHRSAQVLGMLGMAAGLVTLALSPGDSLSIVLAIAVMGIGAAAVTVAAPTFVLGTGLPAALQSRQLTWLQLNLDLGKIVGGLLLGVMATQRMGLHAQFAIGGLVIGVLAVLVWAASRYAADRIRKPDIDLTAAQGPSDTAVPWRTLLLSLFGVPVVGQLLGSATVMEVQISTMLTVSGAVGIGLYFLAGHWMARSGPGLVWAIGHTLRGAGGAVLGVLGLLRGSPYLMVLAAFLVLESAPAIAWIAQARSATRSRSGGHARPAVATKASWHSVPVGQPDPRGSRHVQPGGVLVSPSPGLAVSRST